MIGNNIEYNKKGVIIKISKFSNNGKNGQILEYHNNGVIASEKKIQNQLPHGIWKYYTKRNRIYKSTPYENGKINGIELTLNGNDTVSSKICFRCKVRSMEIIL